MNELTFLMSSINDEIIVANTDSVTDKIGELTILLNSINEKIKN